MLLAAEVLATIVKLFRSSGVRQPSGAPVTFSGRGPLRPFLSVGGPLPVGPPSLYAAATPSLRHCLEWIIIVIGLRVNEFVDSFVISNYFVQRYKAKRLRLWTCNREVWLDPAASLSSSNFGQIVHTPTHTLVFPSLLAKTRRCSAVRKVIAGTAESNGRPLS